MQLKNGTKLQWKSKTVVSTLTDDVVRYPYTNLYISAIGENVLRLTTHFTEMNF